ncbi:major facilitator superfamily domain-containing protein [Hygrophoropsis aurantiaca]|uniref:Major facilitator superfamily domain-containing protein n=1 Tax=Hygrophoropsis aurantiaca TaxID=72124 RepID=A0ACB8A0Y9_9AGAM|nr:major facilitator superfamily domain-containing protein [Hygrophoropsis aurantiaca]
MLFFDLALAPLSGYLFDKGYFRSVLATGSSIFVFCFFMLSLSGPHQYYEIFLSQGLGMGIGAGLIFLPLSAAVAQHFQRRKALAMGLLSSSSSLGAIVFSIAFNYLLNGTLTFGWAIRIIAFVVLGCQVLGHTLISLPQATSPDSTRDQDRVLEKGNTPVAVEPEQNTTKPFSGSDSTKKPVQPPVSFWDGAYVTVLLMGFIISLGTWFPSFYVELFAEQHGISSQLSFFAIAIMNVSNIFGRILPNWLSDRWGALEVYIPCTFLCGAIGFAMLGCTSAYGLVLFTLFYGFFFGTSISLYLPVISSISPNGADIGKRMGVALFPVGVASLIGTPIGGAILGRGYVWWKGVTFSSVSILASGCLLIALKLAHRSR